MRHPVILFFLFICNFPAISPSKSSYLRNSVALDRQVNDPDVVNGLLCPRNVQFLNFARDFQNIDPFPFLFTPSHASHRFY